MYNDKKHFTDKTQEEHMIFGGYNITAGIISLIICIFLALVMISSNPRKTLSYQLIYYGVLLSIAAILPVGIIFPHSEHLPDTTP